MTTVNISIPPEVAYQKPGRSPTPVRISGRYVHHIALLLLIVMTACVMNDLLMVCAVRTR